MPTANLNKKNVLVKDGVDAIVIVKDIADIPGGRTLDVSNVADGTEVIRAGHVIVYDSSTDTYAPMPLNTDGDAYGSLPSGAKYAGVLKHSVLVKDARAAILTMGQVNAAASPYTVTDEIKSGLPNIQFLYA